MCKNNSEKTIISRNHKENSKDNKNNSKKITFYNFFIGTWKFKQYVM